MPSHNDHLSDGDTATAGNSATAAVLQETARSNKPIVLYSCFGLLISAILLSAVFKIDRVITAAGQISPSRGYVYVQPLSKGVVMSVFARPGEIVDAHQLLATIDPSFSEADLQSTTATVKSLNATAKRLEAEVRGIAYVPERSSAPYDLLEATVYRERRREYNNTIDDFVEKSAASRASLQKTISQIASARDHVQRLSQVEGMERKVDQAGFGSELRLLRAADDRGVAEGALAALEGDKIRLERETEAIDAERRLYEAHWKSDASSELAKAQHDLEGAQGALTKAGRTHTLSEVRAPVRGVVLSEGRAYPGSVFDPGDPQKPLFTLTPVDDSLAAELTVPSRDIGEIRVADKVNLKLDAFRFDQHGTAKGVVSSISEGAFRQDDSGLPVAPFFKVRVKITDAKLRNVPTDFRLVPGMTLSGDVVVGGRTPLSYFIGALLRTGSESLREP